MRSAIVALSVIAFIIMGCASAEVKQTEELQQEASALPPEPVQEEVAPKEPEPAAVEAGDSEKVSLKRIAVASALKDREPVDPAEVFPSTVGRVYCFTHIVNANGPKQITHKWYLGETLVSSVNLKINGASWRTYSSKTINLGQTGLWKVEVLGPDGEMLGEIRFEIK